MDLQFAYTKTRNKFGKNYSFADRLAEIHVNIPPDPELSKQFIERNPVDRSIQCSYEMSEHTINTMRKETHIKGINHTEGGWPREVNAQEAEQVQRFRKKVEKDEHYILTIQNLGKSLEHTIKQNNVLDIYETYFEGVTPESSEEPPKAKTIRIFRDPYELKRSATHISWYPNAVKLAVAYCNTEFNATENGVSYESFIWDMSNTSKPDMIIKPHSPLVCLEYNPKDCHILAGGCYNGQVACWDTRKGTQPVESSSIEKTHQKPVWKTIWIQSKTGTEFFSSGTDGQVMWWDIRKLSEPYEVFFLDPDKKSEFDNAQGAYSLEYEATIPTKFMAGTEQGLILSCNRKGKTPAEKIQGVFTGHLGPVYSIQRNPIYPKMFLSIGDWSARIWSEDIKESPILWTNYSNHSLIDGCWSPIRPAVFYVAKVDGTLEVWDLLFKQSEPALIVQVCDEPLQSLRLQEHGRLAACGSYDGTVTILDFSEGFWTTSKSEKASISSIFERGVLREKIIETRLRELKMKLKTEEVTTPQPDKAEGEGKQEEGKAAPQQKEGDGDDQAGEGGENALDDRVEEAEKDFFASIENDRKKKEKKLEEQKALEEKEMTPATDQTEVINSHLNSFETDKDSESNVNEEVIDEEGKEGADEEEEAQAEEEEKE